MDGPQSLFTQWKVIKILLRSQLFKRLTLCIMLTGIIQEGLQDLMIQYLQLKLDFGIKDQVGHVLMGSGFLASLGTKVNTSAVLSITFVSILSSCSELQQHSA